MASLRAGARARKGGPLEAKSKSHPYRQMGLRWAAELETREKLMVRADGTPLNRQEKKAVNRRLFHAARAIALEEWKLERAARKAARSAPREDLKLDPF